MPPPPRRGSRSPARPPAAGRADDAPRSHAISAVKSGAAALIIPASDDSIHCCATENSMNGTAIQITPSSATSGQSERGTGRRAPGTSASVTAPKKTRRNATSPGSKFLSPSSMNRNEAPQVSATPASRAQSSGPKASALAAAGRGAASARALTQPRGSARPRASASRPPPGRARRGRGRRGPCCG